MHFNRIQMSTFLAKHLAHYSLGRYKPKKVETDDETFYLRDAVLSELKFQLETAGRLEKERIRKLHDIEHKSDSKKSISYSWLANHQDDEKSDSFNLEIAKFSVDILLISLPVDQLRQVLHKFRKDSPLYLRLRNDEPARSSKKFDAGGADKFYRLNNFEEENDVKFLDNLSKENNECRNKYNFERDVKKSENGLGSELIAHSTTVMISDIVSGENKNLNNFVTNDNHAFSGDINDIEQPEMSVTSKLFLTDKILSQTLERDISINLQDGELNYLSNSIEDESSKISKHFETIDVNEEEIKTPHHRESKDGVKLTKKSYSNTYKRGASELCLREDFSPDADYKYDSDTIAKDEAISLNATNCGEDRIRRKIIVSDNPCADVIARASKTGRIETGVDPDDRPFPDRTDLIAHLKDIIGDVKAKSSSVKGRRGNKGSAVSKSLVNIRTLRPSSKIGIMQQQPKKSLDSA